MAALDCEEKILGIVMCYPFINQLSISGCTMNNAEWTVKGQGPLLMGLLLPLTNTVSPPYPSAKASFTTVLWDLLP
jgi:hypothetical protein